MIESADNIVQLIAILGKEIELIDSFSHAEELIMESVLNSNWDNLEMAINQTKELSVLINTLDKQRDDCVEILRESAGENDDIHFYRLTAKLEINQKNKVNDLYRTLKLSVLNLQNINWRIDAYVGTVTGIMKQTLKDIYPNRRGSLYSKTGTIREAENNPMVLNRKL